MSDFETFVLEPANRAAAAAARAMADGTGLPDRPLIVLGGGGTGKTELLQAMASRLRDRHPSAVIELLSPDLLAERYRGALAQGRGDALRAELAAADLVLIDDLEQLARHRECHGLVADLLDGRRLAGRGTVLATAIPVEQQSGLDARLLRRLADGTTVSLALPGPAARAEILLRRLGDHPDALPGDVVRALAAADFPSMRDHTGALSRLVAFQEASAVPLSPADAMLLIGAPALRAAPEPAGEPAPEPAPDPAASPAGPEAPDEFGAFLSEVAATVSEQVDRWRRSLEEAVQRWREAGLRTGRLDALLQEDLTANPEPALEAEQRPDYVCANVRGYMSIPGARLVRVAPNYFPDAASDNWGVIIDWTNPLPAPLRHLPVVRSLVAMRIRQEVRAEWDARKRRVHEAARLRTARRVDAAVPEPELVATA